MRSQTKGLRLGIISSPSGDTCRRTISLRRPLQTAHRSWKGTLSELIPDYISILRVSISPLQLNRLEDDRASRIIKDRNDGLSSRAHGWRPSVWHTCWLCRPWGKSHFRGIGKQDSHRKNTLTGGTRWSRCVLLPGRLILNHSEGRQRGHELLYAYAVKVHRRLIAVAFEDRAPTVPEMADRLAGF